MNKLVLVLLLAVAPIRCSGSSKIFNYSRYDLNKEYYGISVNAELEQIMDFRPLKGGAYPAGQPARIGVSNVLTNSTYPLFITASQQSVTSSWQLPMAVDARSEGEYSGFARTLCPSDSASESNWPLVRLSTQSPETVLADIYVDVLQLFNVSVGNASSEWNNLTLVPNYPQYFAFRFDEDATDKLKDATPRLVANAESKMPKFKSPKTVILMVESDDDFCATVSIQNLSCPVYDNERDVEYRGYYFTMMRRGGITLSQAHFPAGFYLVLLFKSSDEECTGAPYAGPASAADGRRKTIRFKVVETISYKEYAPAASLVLGGLLLYVAALAAVPPLGGLCRRGDRVRHEPLIVPADSEGGVASGDDSNVGAGASSDQATFGADSVAARSDCDLVETTEPVESEPAGKLMLSQLARQSADVLKGRSDKYLWGVLTISVFYSLPVIQLIVTYQGILQETGDQDLCYYNFLCAHPLGLLSDFNHVYSNVGYVLLGAAFLVLVRRRQQRHERRPELHELGIPQHFGIYYAMGVSLMVEGLLSASYHFCPNKMNFQFDSSFMYVMAVLCMVKLYQNRHPDVNARAHATFAVLAVVIFVGLSGILLSYVELRMALWFWVAVCYLHVLFNLYLSFHIYYMGGARIERAAAVRVWRRVRARSYRLRPDNPKRLLMIVVFNAANCALDAYALHRVFRDRTELPVHLLQVLLMNTALYTAAYIAMKLWHGERIAPPAALLLLASNALWALSLYLFINGRSKWALTPAESRGRNAPCQFLQFFDTHDAWHLTSAVAMFNSFHLLLTVDDDLALTPRHKIHVF